MYLSSVSSAWIFLSSVKFLLDKTRYGPVLFSIWDFHEPQLCNVNGSISWFSADVMVAIFVSLHKRVRALR